MIRALVSNFNLPVLHKIKPRIAGLILQVRVLFLALGDSNTCGESVTSEKIQRILSRIL